MLKRQLITLAFAAQLLLLPGTNELRGADWPMWRAGAGRRAVSAGELPARLAPVWVRYYPERLSVWDDPLNHDLMPYDRVFEPVVGGGRMYVGFNDSDKLMALDADTGEELWRSYAGGPVRLPPLYWNEAVYFVSDDGYIRCLDAANGNLRWKFRGGPSDRMLLGNRRLISTWPARGGPVIVEGAVYFSASIWPFMGTFIYALDAVSGQTVWQSDNTGSQFMLQPHNSPAFAGIAPQGAFVASGNSLLVPGGRSVPGCYELKDGSQRYYHLAANNHSGGSFVCAAGDVFFNHHRDQVCSMYDLATGARLVHKIGMHPVLADSLFYLGGETVSAYDAAGLQHKARWFLAGSFIEKWLAGIEAGKVWPPFLREMLQNYKKRKSAAWREALLWELETDATRDLIRSGGSLYAAGADGITAISIDGSVSWHLQVDGGVERLLTADGKLFAVTLDGRIMAFGAGSGGGVIEYHQSAEDWKIAGTAGRKAKKILSTTGVDEGYAFVRAPAGLELAKALADNSRLQIVLLESDSARIETARRRFDKANLYGSRVAVVDCSAADFSLPPYAASLIVADGKTLATQTGLLNSLRPYGGKAWIDTPAADAGKLERWAAGPGVELSAESRGGALILTRDGSLRGAASWTHQYGNPANTIKSDDSLVSLPLGLLWFGGSSNLDVLPRHGHGPPEQVIGGRLFIEGMNCISARDVYTGRVLWKTDLDLGNYGVYYDDTYKDAPTSTEYNQVHLPGANIRGANYVATLDRVYVIEGGRCRVLDAVSGETLDKFELPAAAGEQSDGQWSYLAVLDDYLIAGGGFVPMNSKIPADSEHHRQLAEMSERDRTRRKPFMEFDKSASLRLIVMDRFSGKQLWTRRAEHGFLHNAIVAGGGMIYCLDKRPPYVESQLRRRGESSKGTNRLLALNIATGELAWELRDGVFGSWLGLSGQHGVLLQSTRPSRDMVRGETGKRMAVYNAATGVTLWDREMEYSSVPILHGERIITAGAMFSLLSGEALRQYHPLTGEQIPVSWKRNYGCNYPIASEHLLTFRSAAAGYYDLDAYGGTGNLGGFKSGCTSNLVAADGVLNAPDYTRTCACSYQNQTSLAMINDPDAEYWTFNDIQWGGAPIRRLGLNFGAPGDRMDDDGVLWLDYPSRGGPSPEIPVTVTGENIRWFCSHSSAVTGEGPRWVGASGMVGASEITVQLSKEPAGERPYRLNLVFASGKDQAGGASFDIFVQGEKLLENVSVPTVDKGNKARTVVAEIERVMADRELKLRIVPSPGSAGPGAALCGLKIAALD